LVHLIFHQAIGQFFNYHLALEEQQPERVLYLAIPSGIYYSFFQLQFIKTVVQRSQLKIMIYDPVQEVIVAWKN